MKAIPYSQHSAGELATYIANATPAQVVASLRNPEPKFSDFLHFISPAAEAFLPEMGEAARRIKLRYFGKTVRMYAPLYISNFCINNCVYCGFRSTFHYERRRLSFDEVMDEAKIIKDMGHASLLLITGEDPKGASVEFTARCIRELKKDFAYINIEYYPMSEENYRTLFEAGCHGLTLYQETYDSDLYKTLHPSGPKADYNFRLNALAAGGRAGFYNLGMGALLGLNPDWRLEAANLAIHGLWIRKHFWRSRTQFSFPRITPTLGGYNVPSPLTDRNLEQMILAFRLMFAESDLYLSTREKADFRLRMAELAVSHLSAGSQVSPGGYRESVEKSHTLGQFSMNDQSSVTAVVDGLKQRHLEPVFKDWDGAFR
ncbi:MAG: 2-iminoacetate synthase ThiH [Victivallaceae bacterium]